VPVAALLERKAFAFSGTAVPFAPGTSGWNAIDFRPGTLAPTGAVPAAADEASLEWSLGIKLGDELAIHDEAGRERRLRINAAISNSLFQGSVLVSEDEFLALFPSSGGYTRFLVDAPGFSRAAREKLAADIQNGLRTFGAEAITAEARLFRFNEVANTYLLMFLILGGLGLLIGIGGFGVFIRQSMAGRMGEIALLRAIGIPGRLVFRQLLAEQCLVLAGALGLGLLASFSALLPIALKAADRLPWAAVAGLVLVMAGGGFLLVRREVRRALRTDIMSALKNE
jgi:putative ABC transport system permease protein